MAVDHLGSPLTSSYAIAGGEARLFERGATITGPAGAVEVAFDLPMIGNPSIASPLPPTVAPSPVQPLSGTTGVPSPVLQPPTTIAPPRNKKPKSERMLKKVLLAVVAAGAMSIPLAGVAWADRPDNPYSQTQGERDNPGSQDQGKRDNRDNPHSQT